MRPGRWLLAGLTLLLAAVIAAAWVLPGRLDGERFRAPLQRLASRTLGAPVRLAGPIRLRLLPRPMLEAGGLSVAFPGGGTAASLTTRGVRLFLSLAPLLAGRIEASSLLLYQPDLVLPGRLDGRLLLLRHPAWLGSAETRIEDGRIEAGGFALTGIDARIAAEPLTGDLAGRGTASLPGRSPVRRWTFSVRLTQPGGDGAAGIELSLAGRERLAGTALDFSGQLSATGGLQGHGAAHGPDLSLLLPTPALPFTAAGRVSVADGLAEADDLTLQLGAAPARGAVALRLSPLLRLDLALAASRLELDPWLALLRGKAAGWGSVPVGVDLSAEAGTLAGGTLRGLRAAFDFAPAGSGDGAGEQVSVRELRATLPGDAALRLTGTARGGRFEGEASLAAPAWPVTGGWLASLRPAGLETLPSAPVTAVDVSAHVRATSGSVAFSGIAGTLDGARVAGAFAWQLPVAAARARLSADLQLQTLALEPWLAAGAPGPDLDLRVAALRATWRGLALAPFRVDAARQDGAWAVRRLQARSGALAVDAAGRLSATGRLDDGRLTLDAQHLSALQGLPGMPALPLPVASPLLRAPLHLAVQGSGTREALSASVQATLGDLALEAQPRVNLAAGRWSGPLTLHDPSARLLLEASSMLPPMELSTDAAWLGEGSLALSAECAGTTATLTADGLAVTAGSLRATGALRFAWGAMPSLSGRLDADTLPLPPWSAGLADAWLPGGVPRGTASLSLRARRVLADGVPLLGPLTAEVGLAAGRLRLDAVQAGLAGGTLEGSAVLDLGVRPPAVSLRASVRDATLSGGMSGLPVDIVGGRMTGQASLSATGHSVEAMRASMQGSLSTTVVAGSLRGVGLGGLPADLPPLAVAAALSGGTTGFDRAALELHLDHGVATLGEGRVALPSGAVTIAGSYDLVQDAADLTLTFHPAVPPSPLDPGLAPPAIGLRLLGGRGRVQRIAELAPLARWRAARDQP